MARGRTCSRAFKFAAVAEVAERGDAACGPPDGTSTVAVERTVAEWERFCGQLAVEHAALKKGLRALPSRSGTR